MKGFWVGILTFISIAIVGFGLWLGLTPAGHKVWNDWQYSLKKTDEKAYIKQKEVEDTCRAMIASYNTDKLIYEQYKDGTAEQQGWAAQAKMRANQTASTYNNYILQNSFVWRDNVPADIYMTLDYLN